MKDRITYSGGYQPKFQKNRVDWKEKLSNIELEQKENARRRNYRQRNDKIFVVTYLDGTQKQIVADHWTFLRGSDCILEFRNAYDHWICSVNVQNIASWERGVIPSSDSEGEVSPDDWDEDKEDLNG